MTIRVGILTPVDENGNSKLCPRWAESFEEKGWEVVKIPAGAKNLDQITNNIHGLLLPGGDSNIHPYFYEPLADLETYNPDEERDIARDRTAIELVNIAFTKDIPTLGICRGMEEMIVAFGGKIKRLEGEQEHHAAGLVARQEDGTIDREELDRLRHKIEIELDGILYELLKIKECMVNSAHMEGITIELWNSEECQYLRDVFRIEAKSPDGLVEAMSVKPELLKRFFMGVQPHFELKGMLHEAVYGLFKQSIREYKGDQNSVILDNTP